MKPKHLLLVTACLLVSGCIFEQPTTEKTLFVNHYKTECGGVELSLCNLTKESATADWELFYEPIEDFEFEWGYVYELTVEETTIEDPPEEGPSKEYRLLDVVSKTKVIPATYFDLSVSRAPNLISKVTDGTYRIYDEVDFNCNTEACATVDSLQQQDMAVLFQFTYPIDLTQPLVLSQIKCSDDRDSFTDTCL